MEKKNLEIGNKKEELNILKSENIKMKNTLSNIYSLTKLC